MSHPGNNKSSDGISAHRPAPEQSGPFHAKIIGHVDETYMGSLKVQLLKNTSSGNKPRESTQILTARYLSPFGGQTSKDTITKKINRPNHSAVDITNQLLSLKILPFQ